MFITNSNTSLNGSVRDLGNIDYYKRYIIIDSNPNIDGSNKVTIINISSCTGGGIVKVNGKKEKNQVSNIYYGNGYVISNKNIINDTNAKNSINYNKDVSITRMSYGRHNYDLTRRKFSELEIKTSYEEFYEDFKSFDLVPNVLFYNIEHQILNEDINKTEYNRKLMTGTVNGNMDLYNIPSKGNEGYIVKLSSLVDDHTTIHVIRSNDNINSNTIEPEVYDSLDFDINTLVMTTVGPVTDLLLSLLFNEIDFCYDSIQGLSRIRYKTDHVLPNQLYMSQIQDNSVALFEDNMNMINKDIIDCNFRLFVLCRMGFAKLKFIAYIPNNGRITKEFDFEINRSKSKLHSDTTNWVVGNVY